MYFIQVDENGPSATLAGGSAQGGLTFMGLGFLLTGAKVIIPLTRLNNYKNSRSTFCTKRK